MAVVCTLEGGGEEGERTRRRQPLLTLAGVAAAVAALDLACKALAQVLLAGRDVPLTAAVRLTLVPNDGYAWGVHVGAVAPLLQTVLTLAVGVLIVRAYGELAAIDRSSPVALGLIAGAGVGNLVSVLTPPAGVTDFIAISYGGAEAVFNVADVALAIGLALSLRTAAAIVRALPAARSARTAAGVRTMHRADVEVGRPIFVDRPATARPSPLAARDPVSTGDDTRAPRGASPHA